MSNTKEKAHMSIVAQIGCVICRRDDGVRADAEVHHIAEGSAPRSDYMTAGLCVEHHRGAIGVHGAGVKKFLMMYRLPSEESLLGLVNEYRVKDGI